MGNRPLLPTTSVVGSSALSDSLLSSLLEKSLISVVFVLRASRFDCFLSSSVQIASMKIAHLNIHLKHAIIFNKLATNNGFSFKCARPFLEKKKTVIIRNVLSSSAEDHWPVLPDHETEILKEELVRNFSMLKATKVFHAKWSMTTQEEQLMSSKRLECTEVVSKSRAVIRHLRSFIFLGMNALSRAIEGGTVASCLVASDVTPSTLVKPVIQLAISAQTPVFVIKGLKRFCLDSMGFPCIAIGFAKFVACNGEVNPFEEACSLVVQFYNNQRSQSHEAVVHIEENSTKLKSQLPVHTPSTNVCATMPNDSSDFLSAPYSYHLIRGSKYERSYTPDAYSQHKQTHETSTLDVTGLQTKPTEKLSAKLNLPSVLRIKGNPFKLKRKKKKW